MKAKLCVILVGAIALGGCASTTFAPPEVDVYRQMNGDSLTMGCRLSGASSGAIQHNVDGALLLVHNFVNSYRCGMRAAADGRQPFEILSFLSLAGATAAVALGASPDVAIIGAAANGIFTAGNKYFAPQEQTEILSSAVDALLCIQTESVGIAAFDSTVESEALVPPSGGGSVEINTERIYFNMVTAALLSVERVAAQRLSRRGSFDAEGVAGELEVQRQRLEDARDQRNEAMALFALGRASANSVVVLRLEELRPKLQLCVTRAKI